MKKTIKTMLAFVAGALALSACSNEDSLFENDNNGAQLVTLTAYQESDDTKAAIDGTDSKKIDWTANDKINYFGGATGQSMTLKTGAGTTSGTFEGTVTTGSDDYVLYPYNAEATCTSGTITTTIPSAQSVPAGTFDPAAGLMVGKVNGANVQFYNAVGYIAIKIPAGSSNITKMVITGNNNERLSGKVTISGITTDAAPTNIAGTQRTITDATSPTGVTDGVKYVEVTPNGTSTFTAGSTYYVAVAPDATLSKGIYVLLYDGSTSAPATLKLAVKKSSNSLNMARNKVKKVALPTIDESDWKAMIALTGCYMAPFNLGATKSIYSDGAEAYGNYYPFGEIDTNVYPKESPSAYTGTAALTGLTDAATSNWGPDWRMATSTEWTNNNNKYPVCYFLPNAGYRESTGWINQNRHGYYWSSDPAAEANNAYYIKTIPCNYSASVTTEYRGNGNSIRPILAPDLSATESANCYIVSAAGKYKFKTVQGNSSDAVGTVASVAVLWETFGNSTDVNTGDLVNNVSYENNYITFTATDKKGNALIAAKDASGKILWSWHIWLTDAPEDVDYGTAGKMMDRNLGATSTTAGDVETYGLLYQWGRKDPFLNVKVATAYGTYSSNVATHTGTLNAAAYGNSTQGNEQYSILNPTVFLMQFAGGDWHYNGNDGLWGSTKTKYDPCPAGYRVPDADFWVSQTGAWDSTNKGRTINGSWYPASGIIKRADGTFANAGTAGYYWTIGTNMDGSDRQAYALRINSEGLSAQNVNNRAWGFAVRCQKIE